MVLCVRSWWNQRGNGVLGNVEGLGLFLCKCDRGVNLLCVQNGQIVSIPSTKTTFYFEQTVNIRAKTVRRAMECSRRTRELTAEWLGQDRQQWNYSNSDEDIYMKKVEDDEIKEGWFVITEHWAVSTWLACYVDVGHCWISATQLLLMNRDHDKKLYDIRKDQ